MTGFPFLEDTDRGEGSHQTVERTPINAHLVGYVLQRPGLTGDIIRQSKHHRNMDSLRNLVAIHQLKKRTTWIVTNFRHSHLRTFGCVATIPSHGPPVLGNHHLVDELHLTRPIGTQPRQGTGPLAGH